MNLLGLVLVPYVLACRLFEPFYPRILHYEQLFALLIKRLLHRLFYLPLLSQPIREPLELLFLPALSPLFQPSREPAFLLSPLCVRLNAVGELQKLLHALL